LFFTNLLKFNNLDGGVEGYRSVLLRSSARLQKKMLTRFLLLRSLRRTPRTFALQKRVFGTLHPTKEKSLRSNDLRLFSWLGWRDSNPRMPVPKTGALPLGHTPLGVIVMYFNVGLLVFGPSTYFLSCRFCFAKADGLVSYRLTALDC
jgi:hypothetical protein